MLEASQYHSLTMIQTKLRHLYRKYFKAALEGRWEDSKDIPKHGRHSVTFLHQTPLFLGQLMVKDVPSSQSIHDIHPQVIHLPTP